jgi:DNA repair protein RadD
MDEVASILDTAPITEAVIKHWKEKAAIARPSSSARRSPMPRTSPSAFVAAGVPPSWCTASCPMPTARLAGRLRDGAAQVVVNVAVLTEGYDYTPTGCVVLLRPSSYKSTLIQMVGRGLRTVDPEEFPGVIKTDCIVLDFGTASLMHGSLEQDVNLDGHLGEGRGADQGLPECGADRAAGLHGVPAVRPRLGAGITMP